MMIVMRTDATAEQIHLVVSRVEHFGLQAHLWRGVGRTVIGVVGDGRPIRMQDISAF
jgi:3-deoxy-7-phosphoheptulonate synthase